MLCTLCIGLNAADPRCAQVGTLPNVVQTAVIVVAAFTIVLNLCFLAVLFKFRNSKLVKAGSHIFLFLLLCALIVRTHDSLNRCA